MADHIALQIRDRIVTTVTDLTTTGDRVYKARVYPIQNEELPALTVRVGEIEQEIISTPAPQGVLNKCTYAVRIHVSEDGDVDAALFLSAKEVAEALGADINLNSLALAAYPEGISEPEYISEGKQKIASMDVFWAAEWDSPINDVD